MKLAPLAALALLTAVPLAAQRTERQLISGSGSDSTVPWEFRVSGGRRAGQWSTIPVPSNWEMQGFGTYHYRTDWQRDRAPDSVAEYRHTFRVPAAWRGGHVEIVFGAVMTDADVRLNGRSAGPTHRGGFYQFRYDVGRLLRYDAPNVLEVRVGKFSSDSSINRAERSADFWLFGGIFRPVWLEASPPQHVARVAVDARHTGALAVDVFLGGLTTLGTVSAQVLTLAGAPVGAPLSAAVAAGQEKVALRGTVRGARPWSAEWPNRYRLRVRLASGGRTVHETTETFGFRTVEVRPHDGFYVNGVPVRLKGVDRHTFWPTTGRATNRALSVQDAQLIKDMNMNAVRMSHYPPDPHFLDAADSLGLYVLDELTGWQQAYSTEAGRPLVRELVVRDVNHPSIVLWDNGNEGGFNFELDPDFAKWDPQHRTVIHPWLNSGGINTSHYESYDCCVGSFFHGDDLFMPTEFLHGLYDGGAGAGLDDWWRAMLAHPLGVGGFIWAFADEGIVRDDEGGRVDVAGNQAPDGVVGPYRQKEGSFFTIKEVWSPVYVAWSELDRLPPTFDGSLRVENRYDFTGLGQVRFAWSLLDFAAPNASGVGHRVAARGTAPSPDVPPRGVGALRLPLPNGWRRHDALALTATDPHGRELFTWTWMIPGPDSVAARVVPAPPASTPRATGELQAGALVMRAGDTEVRIDPATGRLAGVTRGGVSVSLRDGPRLVAGAATLQRFDHRADGSDYVAEARYAGDLQRVRWRLMPNGWLRLDYAYRPQRDTPRDWLGVTFDYAERDVTGLRWLGRGPYRVWKNRRKGLAFDVWEKAYNDAITGVRWEYPEFKGVHADVYWATLGTRELPITMVIGTPDVFLRVLTPAEPTGAEFDPRTTHVAFPPGDLSLLHGIAPIGTKFDAATAHGPSGQPNLLSRRAGPFEATVWFRFGGAY